MLKSVSIVSFQFDLSSFYVQQGMLPSHTAIRCVLMCISLSLSVCLFLSLSLWFQPVDSMFICRPTGRAQVAIIGNSQLAFSRDDLRRQQETFNDRPPHNAWAFAWLRYWLSGKASSKQPPPPPPPLSQNHPNRPTSPASQQQLSRKFPLPTHTWDLTWKVKWGAKVA